MARTKQGLQARDYRLLRALITILEQRPTLADHASFRSVAKDLASLMPKMRRDLLKAMTRSWLDTEVFDYTEKLARIYRGKGSAAEKRKEILRLNSETPDPLGTLLNRDSAETEEQRSTLEALGQIPASHPSDAARELVGQLLMAYGIRGYGQTEFKGRSKVMKDHRASDEWPQHERFIKAVEGGWRLGG